MRILLISLVILLGGCTKKEKTYDLAGLEDEVMDVHDEVMPLMDPLYKTRRDLQKKIDADSATIAPDQYQMIVAAIKELKDSEDAMMEWMHGYDPNFQEQTDSLTYNYLLAQKKSIQEVSMRMKAAKVAGEALND